jgi:long-chain acyl-CoA synthetase
MDTHLYDLARRRAAQWPDAIAIGGQEELGWRTLTGRQLLDRIDCLANELAALGVGDGDRVVLWLPNGWRTPVYLFALWKLGAIIVPFDREMNPEAAAQILAAVAPRLVLVGSGERPPWARTHAITEWWEPGRYGRGDPAAPPAWRRPHEELAVISYTSGTTGQPKGCMITHANLCFEVEALQATIPLDPTCRLASILPLSHLFELTCGLLYPLARGAAVHSIPSRRAADMLRVLVDQRITHMIVVPQLLTLLGATIEDGLRTRLPAPIFAALSLIAPRLPLALRRQLFRPVHHRLGGHLRLMASGGAALPAETQALWERLGVRIVQGYGASECAPVVAAARADGSTPAGSVGQPLPGVSVRLTEAGEVLVRGPNVMRGYWRDPQRTAEVLRDGWYHTGDLATRDERGNLRIIGRLKEVIVLPSGMKVWPQDVEAVFEEHPAVRAAALVGVPTAAGGLALHIHLLPAHPHPGPADLRRIIARCNARLAQHQRVATGSWWPAADFPRTALGKLRRHQLPAAPPAQSVAVAAELAEDDPIGQALVSVTRTGPGALDQPLDQLGLDSLGLVELAVALEEKTDKQIADGDLRLEMTVAQLRALVQAAPDRAAGAAGAAGRPRRGPSDRPDWPYTWGRRLRWVRFPTELLYRCAVTRTTVIGSEHLAALPASVILAGTHRSFPDLPLVYSALAHSPARRLVNRLVVPTLGAGILRYRLFGWWSTLAFGLFPVAALGVGSAGLRRLVQLAAQENAILIFPQGRHVTPAQEQAGKPEASFRHGVAYLAAALDAMVIPFGLAGPERLVPPDLDAFTGRRIAGIPLALRRGPLAIAFGSPVRRGADESAAAFAERLQALCFALARAAQAALYGA